MYTLSKNSEKNLMTCCIELQIIVRVALRLGIIDFSVVQGHRGRAEQNRLHSLGLSRVRYPDGKHNSEPSLAVDIQPWVNGASSNDWNHCIVTASTIVAVGRMLGYNLRWGGNWDQDGEPITDQDFQDLFHIEFRGLLYE